MSHFQMLLHRWFGFDYVELRTATQFGLLRRVKYGYREGYKVPYIAYLGDKVWLLPTGAVIGPCYCKKYTPLTFELPKRNKEYA